MTEHRPHGRVQPLVFSYLTQSALRLGRLTLEQYEFTVLNTEGVSPEACESALVPKVGPRDYWGSDTSHERQREEVAEMGVGARHRLWREQNCRLLELKQTLLII